MENKETLDLENIMDELSDRIEDIIEDAIADQVEDAISCSLQDILPKLLRESLSDYEFVLKDGTIVRQKQYMKLFSPDKSKLVLCYGGLRVDGSTLMVQTRVGSWESIAYYKTREEAIEALVTVKNAMDNELHIFEL